MDNVKENQNKYQTKKLKNNSYKIKSFYFNFIFKAIIFLSFINEYFFTQTFFYLDSISLFNGNYFIIHKNGIDIYDSSFTKKLKTILSFDHNETISNFAISNFNDNDNDIIVNIINNKIYIFNTEGENIYSSNKISLLNGKNYSIITLKKIHNEFHYMINFIGEKNEIQFLFFKYEEKNQKNYLVYNISNLNGTENDNYYINKNKGLTCQFKKNFNNNDIIVCFYYINSFKTFIENIFIDTKDYSFIKLNENNNLKINFPREIGNIIDIKSLANFDNSKLFICFYSALGKIFCFTYSINTNNASGYVEYISNCKSKYVLFKYIKETNKYFLSCPIDSQKIKLVVFNKNFEYLYSYNLNLNNYDNNYAYSIVYSYSKENYMVISGLQILSVIVETKNLFNIKKINNLRKTQQITDCREEKCLSCTEESQNQKLCVSCNTQNNYYPSNYALNQLITSSFLECYNKDTKPRNFYLNQNTNYYEPCFSTCGTCEYGGDGNENNCTTCAPNYMEEPEVQHSKNSTNCVVECKHFYYYTSYGQYKCSSIPQCPEETNLLIRKKKKCVQSCSIDKNFRYQYNGECLEDCPEDTTPDENLICRVNNREICSKSISQFNLYDFLKEGGVEKIAKTYAEEFRYTEKHISLFKNDVYSIMLYKNAECITELELPMPEIDFGTCYSKVKAKNIIKTSLIVAIIDKKSNKKSNPITSYSFYHPITGEKLESEQTCKENIIVVKENIKSLLNDSVQDMSSILFLTEQNIDVFNESSDFYTDICYHYESPCDKDVALRDRLLIYYPNITLCDTGCSNAGVNLTSMTAICECKFKEVNEDDDEDDKNLYKSAVNEVFYIFNQINVAVMACYKDLFQYKYFISCTGGIIILVLILVQIIDIIVFYFISFFSIKKYIYNMTENYLLYLNKSPMYKPNLNKKNEEEKKSQRELNYPPKKNNSESKDNSAKVFRIHESKKQSLKAKRSDNKKKMLKTQEGSEEKINSKAGLYGHKLFSKKSKSKSNGNITQVKFDKSALSLKSDKSSLTNISNKNKDLSFFNNYLITPLNEMLFNDALVNDNRLFFDYFCDKIKRKQTILELFLVEDPIKSKTLKLLLLILDIEVCLVVNGMFINEDYVSKLFHSTKKETFISFLPRSVDRCFYTVLSSIIISYIVGCFFIEERRLKSVFKYEKNNIYSIKYEVSVIMKEMFWRYTIFIIFTVIISAFSWYYISCFNNIYPHMKNEWIKSSIFIILLVHIFSIFITLIETLLRFLSFEFKSEKMYKASLWLA